MLCMVQDELTEAQREEQITLMKNVPSWKQRIAGKSLPMEKFAVRKADRFITQGHFLVLPAIELIYVWNGFRILGQSWKTIEPLYILIEKAEAKAIAEKGNLVPRPPKSKSIGNYRKPIIILPCLYLDA